MPRLLVWLVLVAALPTVAPLDVRADDDRSPMLDPRLLHTWARFPEGSWKRMRVITETYGEDGTLISTGVQQSTTTLVEVGQSDYTLRIELQTEVAGQRFPPQQRTIVQPYWEHEEGEGPELQRLDDERLVINGAVWPTQVYEVLESGGEWTRSSRLWWSADRRLVLRKLAVTSGTARDQLLAEQRVDVLALDMPFWIAERMWSVAVVRAVETMPDRRSVTVEATSADVPGAVVLYTAKRLTLDGQLLRRSYLELIDYGLPE